MDNNRYYENKMIFEFFGILDIPIQYIFNENENEGGIKFLGVFHTPPPRPQTVDNIELLLIGKGNECDMVFEKMVKVNNKKGFDILGDLVSPHILFMANEMVFKFFSVFDTPNPTPRPQMIDNENDFDNGILQIPQLTFENDFGYKIL